MLKDANGAGQIRRVNIIHPSIQLNSQKLKSTIVLLILYC